MSTTPPQRRAAHADVPRIESLMRRSVEELFPHFHDARDTAAAAKYLTVPDTVLIDDGTYYVHESGGEIIACGGWSKRDKLYTGSGDKDGDARVLDPATEPARVRAMFVRGDFARRGIGRAILTSCADAAKADGYRSLVLMATLPGVPLYAAFGFQEVSREDLPLPDGTKLAGVAMEMKLS